MRRGLVWVIARTEKPPPYYVESYRVEANYGPEDPVLNPIFKHEGRLEAQLIGGYSPTSSVENHYSAGGSLAFHINRRHAIEPVWYNKVWGKVTDFVKTEVGDKVSDKFPASAAEIRANAGVEIPQQIFAASYLFSPYYAKMSLTERTVAHFDVFFAFGVAALQGQETFLDGTTGAKNWRVGGNLGAGLRFTFPERFAIRLELRDFVHQARHFETLALQNTFQLNAGLSLFLF